VRGKGVAVVGIQYRTDLPVEAGTLRSLGSQLASARPASTLCENIKPVMS